MYNEKEPLLMHTQKEMDHVHDTLIDLIISCMMRGHIPYEEPKEGDWCFERSSFRVDHDHCVGKLIKRLGDGKYQILTIGGKIVTWSNAELTKIPSDYLRKSTTMGE